MSKSSSISTVGETVQVFDPVNASTPMKRPEKLAVLGLFLALWVIFGFCRIQFRFDAASDFAIMCETADNVASTGVATNTTFLSVLTYVDRIASLPAEQAETVDLSPPEPHIQNHFNFHAYLILYLMAPFVWFMSSNVLWQILIAGCYACVPFAFYWFLRKRGVSFLGAALFAVVATAHPSWSWGIQGQIFPDRLFLGFGTAFLFAFTARRPKVFWTLFWAVLASLVIERAALVVGAFAIGYTLLFWKQRRGVRGLGLALGLGALSLGAFVILFVLDNRYYAGTSVTAAPAYFSSLFENLKRLSFWQDSGSLLLVNLGLLVLAAFRPKSLLLAAAMLAPNFLGDIGGAEKTGWPTHYHSLYYPFVLWAAASGYLVLHERIRHWSGRVAMQVVVTVAAIFVMGVRFERDGTVSVQDVEQHYRRNAVVLLSFRAYGLLDPAYRDFVVKPTRLLQEAIPEGSVVSGPERLYVSLYENRQLYLFPIGLEEADYAIPEPMTQSYLGPANTKMIQAVLMKRMERLGFDMANPIQCGQFVVYGRL